MTKTLCAAAIMFLASGALADPDRAETRAATEPRVEMSLGTSVHDLRTTTDNGTCESALPIPTMPTVDLRVSFPAAFLASGVGVRTTWVMPALGSPSTVLVDAFYSFGFRPKRLHGVTPTFTVDVGPSIASVSGLDPALHTTHSYAAHVDVGAVASVSWGVYFAGFLARITGGYRAGLSTCGSCGIQWDGDAFASIDIGFALDVSPSRRPL